MDAGRGRLPPGLRTIQLSKIWESEGQKLSSSGLCPSHCQSLTVKSMIEVYVCATRKEFFEVASFRRHSASTQKKEDFSCVFVDSSVVHQAAFALLSAALLKSGGLQAFLAWAVQLFNWIRNRALGSSCWYLAAHRGHRGEKHPTGPLQLFLRARKCFG